MPCLLIREINQERLRDMLDITGAGNDGPRTQPEHVHCETHAHPHDIGPFIATYVKHVYAV